MNNGKYQSDQYLRLQAEKNDRRYGAILLHNKICAKCRKEFVWEGREKTKAYLAAIYCSRSCSNSIGGAKLADIREENGQSHYRTICKKYHNWGCVVCSEKLIVEVHHLNEDHDDNRPENLVPLCPTHHQYVHSPHRHLVQTIIDDYVEDKWGIGIAGNTLALRA